MAHSFHGKDAINPDTPKKRFVCIYDREEGRPIYSIEKTDQSPISLNENKESVEILYQVVSYLKNTIARFSDPPLPGPVYNDISKELRWPESWDLERKVIEVDSSRREQIFHTRTCDLHDPKKLFLREELTSLVQDYGEEIIPLIEEMTKLTTEKYQIYKKMNNLSVRIREFEENKENKI